MFPQKSVTLIDRTPFPNPSAAAHDLNKIIPAEYEDKVYMKLALEAQSLWRSDPVLKPYYHEMGILFAGIPGPGITIVENYKAVRGSSPATLIEPEEAKAKFDGIYRDAPWDKLGVTGCTWNPSAGWGEAENA
jgi:sarcosine oxidase/L-pipecolate oxidase